MMVIIVQLALCLYNPKRFVIYVDDRFLPHNVMFRLMESLDYKIHLFILGGVLSNCIRKSLTMIGHSMPLLIWNCTNRIVGGMCLNFKRVLQVWKCDYMCKENVVLHLNECLMLGLRLGKLFFHSSLRNLMKRPSDMGESQN